MKAFFLQPQFTESGDTVFRSVGVTREDMPAMTKWYFTHQEGREVTKASFGVKRFCWRDPRRKKIADFPSSGEPGGIYSVKAVNVLRDLLEPSGDLHRLMFEGNEAEYFLFDCWSKLQATPNSEFNMFRLGSLKSIAVKSDAVLSDICSVDGLPGLVVSERFKLTAEAAGLTGMQFYEIEIQRH